MAHAADLGSKRLVGLAPQAWVEWLLERSDVEVGPIITSDFQWVGREGDVLIPVHSPDAGTFLVGNEINLRYSNLMPRRTRAYAALRVSLRKRCIASEQTRRCEIWSRCSRSLRALCLIPRWFGRL